MPGALDDDGDPSTEISQQKRNDVLGNVSHTRNNTDTNCIKKYSVVFANHLDTRAEKLCLSVTLIE